jgi:cytochrome P450
MDPSPSTEPWKPGRTGAPRPPVARGLPLLGNLLDLARDSFPLMLSTQRELGPIFRIRAMGAEIVCLVGPDANAFITRAGDDYLVTGEGYQGFNEAFKSRSFLIGLNGAEHAHLRRIERRAMSREALDRKLPEAVAMTDRHISRWRDGAKVDVVRELKSLVVATSGSR